MELRTFSLLLISLLFACAEEDVNTNEQPSGITSTTTVINDEIKGEPVVIYINGSTETMVAFSRQTSRGVLEFSKPNISNNSFFVDNLGNRWDIFGEGISEANRGEKLAAMNYLYGYWFVFPAFYDSINIYEDELLTFAPLTVNDPEWLIPTSALSNTGGKDFIPSIDNPEYLNSDEIIRSNPAELQYPDLNSLATVVKIGNDILVYPHYILNYHEIVNDSHNGVPFTLSFCPLTQTSQLWQRSSFEENTFGVSGVLYNSNLILYDRETDSNWSQVMQKSIQGNLIGDHIQVDRVAEMTLKSALQLPGNPKALSTSTGSNRNYSIDFYEDYKKAADAIIHPVVRRSDALPAKEKVLGVITSEHHVKIYQYP